MFGMWLAGWRRVPKGTKSDPERGGADEDRKLDLPFPSFLDPWLLRRQRATRDASGADSDGPSLRFASMAIEVTWNSCTNDSEDNKH